MIFEAFPPVGLLSCIIENFTTFSPDFYGSRMTGTAHIGITLAIFTGMLVLMVLHPRRWNDAWWTTLAAAAMLTLGLVTPHEALASILAGKNALLFLLSLLALSMLVGRSGFFDWAAIHCARIAKGDANKLYRNAFLAGAVITVILSLDTTAVMLTPVLLALTKRLRIPTAPYVILCAFAANVGSLMLPISNLTNLLFADAFRQTFAAFAARMIMPQLVALASTFAVLRWRFRRDLPSSFDNKSLPDPDSVVPNRFYFMVCMTTLGAVLSGYFLAPLVNIEPYVCAFAACGVLLIAGMATGRVQIRIAKELSWEVFPFVIGLFVAVQGLENLGIVGIASGWLVQMRTGSLQMLFASGFASAVASNLMNNLPAALIARSVLLHSHAHLGTVLASLIGADVGSMVTPFGSLATMLVLSFARRNGEDIRNRDYVIFGLWATPFIAAMTILTLAFSFFLVR
jgi:arsenical pump membrane protein